jgi:energy-coupling factor transport system ATP-binding protein
MGCMAPSIRIENLCAGYRRRPNVLRQLDLSLNPGIYSLSGANGAGKSTLAKVLSGVLRPSAGAAFINGKVAKLWREPGRLVVFGLQNPDVSLFEITVLDELRAGAGAGPAAERRVAAIVRAFGLSEVLSVNPLSLPFPVRKRVSLAATLACPAPWYFLDEPALGADRETTAALAELFREIAAAGHGVIAVSHSRFFHACLAGSPLHMCDGHIQE